MKRLLFYVGTGLILLFFSGCAQPNEAKESEEGVEYLEEVFFCPTEAYVENFEVTDSSIYIAEDAAGFSIWDNESGEKLSHYETPEIGTPLVTNIKQIKPVESGDFLIAYNRYGTSVGLFFIDITDKTSPEWLMTYTGTTDDIRDFHLTELTEDSIRLSWQNGSYKYYTGEYTRLTPALWYLADSDEHVFDYTISGFDEDNDNNRIYIAREEVGVEIVEQDSYETVGRLSSLGQTIDVKVVDNVAFLANREEGILLYDITDEMNPVEIYSYNTTGLASDISIDSSRNLFAIASTSGGAYLFQGPDEETKRLDRIYESEIGYTYKVVLHNGYLYAGTRYGVYKYRIKNI